MSDDAPTNATDDCLTDPDRVLDALANRQASRLNTGPLRSMFARFSTGDGATQRASVATKPGVQQSKPKASFLFTPSL